MKRIIVIITLIVIVAVFFVGKNYYAKRMLSLGEMNFENGNYKIALRELDIAIRFNGSLTRAYLIRGRLLTHQARIDYLNRKELSNDEKRDCKRAIDDFSYCISVNPRDTGALLSRGIRYEMLGEYEDAIKSFNEAIEVDSTFHDAYFRKAWVLEKKGLLNDAIENYSCVIRLDSTNGSAHNNRGHIYEMLGEYKKALNDYNKAILYETKSFFAYNNKANLLLRSGNSEEVLRLKRMAARLGSKEAQLWVETHH
jgi:tetratricopeptide (TPR) repeat protein